MIMHGATSGCILSTFMYILTGGSYKLVTSLLVADLFVSSRSNCTPYLYILKPSAV